MSDRSVKEIPLPGILHILTVRRRLCGRCGDAAVADGSVGRAGSLRPEYRGYRLLIGRWDRVHADRHLDQRQAQRPNITLHRIVGALESLWLKYNSF